MACFTLALLQGEGRVRAMCVERKRRISHVEFMLVVVGLAKLISSVSVPKNPFLCSKMLYLGVHEKLRFYNRRPAYMESKIAKDGLLNSPIEEEQACSLSFIDRCYQEIRNRNFKNKKSFNVH
ncbi:MAG: hypothetical protein AB9891_16725 [Anaerolineaceae bacterium]